jgi:hypothetical protein
MGDLHPGLRAKRSPGVAGAPCDKNAKPLLPLEMRASLEKRTVGVRSTGAVRQWLRGRFRDLQNPRHPQMPRVRNHDRTRQNQCH